MIVFFQIKALYVQMILCEGWHDSGLQDSTKHFMCTLLDEMELVRNLGHRS